MTRTGLNFSLSASAEVQDYLLKHWQEWKW